MSNVPVYAVVNLAVTDAAAYRQYEKGFFPLLKKYGGEAQARAWYADPEYQALSEHRRAGTRLEFLTVVRGLPPR